MAAFAALSTPSASADGTRAVEASARASVLAATVDVQPAFDPAVADSRASASSVGTSSLDSVAWPSFLIDAFFFLYGFQSVERVALGVAEARWPQGPAQANATQSDLVFANGGDPRSVPAKGGKSGSYARSNGAGGDVAVAEVSLPGGLEIGHATSASSVARTAQRAVATARQSLARVAVGPVRIAAIDGSATATADARGVTGDDALLVTGATVDGVPVDIRGDGIRAATEESQRALRRVLDVAGIEIRLVPGEHVRARDAASASSGGVLITMTIEAQDPSGTPRNAKIGYLLGSATASARSSALPPTGGRGVLPEHFEDPAHVLPSPSGPATAAIGSELPRAADDVMFRRRTVTIESASAPGIRARGAYLALTLLALALVFARPLVRAAARP